MDYEIDRVIKIGSERREMHAANSNEEPVTPCNEKKWLSLPMVLVALLEMLLTSLYWILLRRRSKERIVWVVIGVFIRRWSLLC